jgi:hypothetical protein
MVHVRLANDGGGVEADFAASAKTLEPRGSLQPGKGSESPAEEKKNPRRIGGLVLQLEREKGFEFITGVERNHAKAFHFLQIRLAARPLPNFTSLPCSPRESLRFLLRRGAGVEQEFGWT